MSEEEIILVPMTRKECDTLNALCWSSYVLGVKEGEGLALKLQDCFEGKDGLCKKEIETIHSMATYAFDWYEEIGAEADKEENEVIEKLKRWIE